MLPEWALHRHWLGGLTGDEAWTMSCPASTRSSVRWPRPCADRSASWPARAPARPGRSPTGSPTRCAAGVVDAPQRARGDLHHPGRGRDAGRGCAQLGAPGVQARTFHAAALRQLSYFWPRRHRRRRCPRLIDRKLPAGRSTPPPVACAADRTVRSCATSPREIEWAKVTQIDPEDYAAAAAKAGRDAAGRPGRGGRPALRGVRAAQARDRRLIDFEDLLRADRRGDRGAPATSPSRSAQQYRHFVVDEYQDVNPLQQRLLDAWLGGRDDLSVVGDASQTIYSFTGATPRYLLDFRRRTPTPPWSGWSATTAPPRRWSAWPTGHRPGPRRPRSSGSSWSPSGPPAPSRPSPSTPTSPPRPTARRGACAELIAAGVPAREIAVLFRINAQSEAYEQALADAGVPYVLRGARAVLRAPRGAPGGACCCAARPAPADARRRRSPRAGPRRRWRASGWRPTAARRRRGPRALGVAGRAGRPRRGPRPPSRRRRCATFVRRARASARPPSTPRPSRASPSPRCTPPRAWSGTRSSWSALADGTLPIIYAETAEQIEEERRLLYVGVTRAREHLALSWALARSPGGRRAAGPSRFLDGLTGRPRAGRRVSGAVSGLRRERRPVAAPISCRVCGKTLASPPEQKLGRCAACPGRL